MLFTHSSSPSGNAYIFHVVYFGSQPEGGSAVMKEAHQLISDGLEYKLLSIFQDLLSSDYPEQMVSSIVTFNIGLKLVYL